MLAFNLAYLIYVRGFVAGSRRRDNGIDHVVFS